MIFQDTIRLRSNGARPSFLEITGEVEALLAKSGVKNGVCTVYSPHTTCSVLTQEQAHDRSYNGLEFLQQDLVEALERLFPVCRREGSYLHPGPKATAFAAENGESKAEALNTDGHLQSSLLGRSETVVVADGRLDLGQFGRIYFVDLDRTRPRERRVRVQILGV